MEDEELGTTFVNVLPLINYHTVLIYLHID